MGASTGRNYNGAVSGAPYLNKFNYQYYNEDSFRRFLLRYKDAEVVRIRKGKYYRRYYNIPAAFDIECSSFYDGLSKVGLMYSWQLCIDGIVWLGRDYKSFWNMLENCKKTLRLGYAKKLVFYVHNLSYEFNALKGYLDIEEYFATDRRTPIYVSDSRGIEFRCSYKLSGYSLDMLGRTSLHKYKVLKAVGDLDYYKIRTPETPITRREVGYIVNDVRVVCNYIQEKIEGGEDIAHIPLTKTGYVRQALSNNCIKSHKKKRGLNKPFTNFMKCCQITDKEEYEELRECFAGGFTHSSPINTKLTLKDPIIPHDINSAYPHMLATRSFPYGIGRHMAIMSVEGYEENIKHYHIIARFRFHNLQPRYHWDYYLSASKCRNMDGEEESNGRVVRAAQLDTTITEVDYKIIKQAYKYDRVEITDCIIYNTAPLPVDFVKTVLQFYSKKTTLKGVEGAEIEYQNNKELLNSTYGCCATDMIRPVFTYDSDTDTFGREEPDINEEIAKYNKKRGKTVFYPWAIYTTAYVRSKLWNDGILPLGSKYVYSDTDSIYAFDSPEVRAHFDRINEDIIKDLQRVAKERGIPYEMLSPVTSKGKEAPLGIWSRESLCIKFKTLGAKRYLKTTEDGYTSITCAGLSKKSVGYIMEQGGYDYFKENMKVPAEHSGRLTITYIDDVQRGTVTDYKGNIYHYETRSGVHMEPSSYTLNITRLFIDYLKEIKTCYQNEKRSR